MTPFNLSADQQDCLQELMNVAMGQASDQLARYLDTFVYLKVPSIEQIDANELTRSILSKQDTSAVVSQGFFGYEGLRGEALLVYKSDDSHQIADLLGYEENELSIDEQLIDISSILTTTFLNVFAKQIGNQISYNAPRLISSNQLQVSHYLNHLSFHWDLALKVKITYQVTDYSFNCEMILLIPEIAIVNIKTILDRILEEF